MARSTDLDVASPEKVPEVLYGAAQMFRESASELTGAWRPSNIKWGEPWNIIAEELEKSADRIYKRLSRYPFQTFGRKR